MEPDGLALTTQSGDEFQLVERFEVKLTEVDQLAKSNKHRIDNLERSTETLNKLATSVEVIATRQSDMVNTLNRLDNKVEGLEAKPGKRWESLVNNCIWGVAGALLAYALSRIGL